MDSDYPPLSVASLAAYLAAKGHEARVFDLQIPARRETWRAELAAFAPRAIGISAMTPTIAVSGKIGRACKEILPNATLILGGYHVSLVPDDAMNNHPCFDVGVIGEGEVTLHELVEALESGGDLEKVPGLILRRDGQLVTTAPRPRLADLDALPLPHEFYDLDYYLWYGGYTERWTFKCASAIVSRGCPFRCSFCASQRFWSCRYLACSPEHVVDEMRWLYRHGARSVYFRDSTFNVNKKWVREFCDLKRRAVPRMRWLCNSRVDTLTEEQLEAMVAAGLEALYLGVESGSQRILDYYNKGITVQQVRDAFALCRKHGVATAAFFMLGAPVETRADIEASRALARELGARYVYWSIFTPMPGAPLYEDFLAHGYKPDFENLKFNRATIPIGDMTCEELEALHRELLAEFQRKTTRRDVWRRRLEILRSVRSWRDVCHVTRKLARRIGLAKS